MQDCSPILCSWLQIFSSIKRTSFPLVKIRNRILRWQGLSHGASTACSMWKHSRFQGLTALKEKKWLRIPGLDGSGKMGKSEGNAISLAESPASIRKKVMRATTDAGPTEMNQKKPEVIQNLFTLMDVVTAPDIVKHYDEAYNNCTIRYGELKKQLAEDIVNFTTPIRERIEEILQDNVYLSKVAKEGAEKARESASKTLQEVRKIIGFKKFY